MDILDKAATQTAIRAIAKSDGKLRDKIQAAALGALLEAGESGNSGLMSKLVLAVNSTTATQLRKYFQDFAPVKWNTGKGTFSKVKKGGQYRVADAMSVNWFDAIEAKKAVAKEYSADKLLERALTALETAANTAADAGDTETANLMARALVALNPVELKVAA